MATRRLRSIKFPDLEDVYEVKDYDDELTTKAEIDGYYSDMTVGDAEQLVSTVFTEDSVPYNFRTSGGAIDIGDREYDTLVGGTIAWNQLKEGVYEYAVTTTPTTAEAGIYYSNIATAMGVSPLKGHQYLIYLECKNANENFARASVFAGTASEVRCANNNKSYSIKTASNSLNILRVYGTASVETTVDMTLNVFDLTQMFGSTIADYIYSLETANAGAGVAFFKKLFPKPYYAYNAGELMSVKALSHDMVGFNAWDGEWENGDIDLNTGENTATSGRWRTKNYIPILPNATYYAYADTTATIGMRARFYAADKSYIGARNIGGSYINFNSTFVPPANAYYMRFAPNTSDIVGGTNICINISWDGERDGEYEPYVKRSYPLDSNLELRGIPKLSANNDLYYDGDVYEADGTVTRKYGVVDLGTLTWTYLTDAVWNCFTTSISGKANGPSNMLSSKYARGGVYNTQDDKVLAANSANTNIYIRDTAYTTAASFKTAMSGVYLVYELATPTTETADPYNEIQWVDDFGTEEYVDTRDVAVPVGHNTKYVPNLRAKLETAPDSPDADGDYVMRHSNGVNSYIPLASNATIQNIIARLEALEGTEGE